MAIKKRSTLIGYFKKGFIPTQENFKDLINSMLHQEEDDNVFKQLGDDPLKIKAPGQDQALIEFYRVENGENELTWRIVQNPDQKPGLSIHDTKASRLFIESGTGNVGIGTTEPGEALAVNGKVKATAIALDNLPIQTTDSSLLLGRILVRQNDFADRHNYGHNWTPYAESKAWSSVALSADGRIQTAVSVQGGQIYVSTNSGATWAPHAESEDWLSVASGADVALSADGRIQTAVIYGGQIYVSRDWGKTWTPYAESKSWLSVALSADGRIQTAVVYGGQIYVSRDWGKTWTPHAESKSWISVALSADGRIQTAVAQGGQIYVSTDWGKTWTPYEESKSWSSVALSADGRIQTAVVYGGQIYVSTDSGATWTPGKEDKDGKLEDLSEKWQSVAMSADGRIQTAVAQGGQIYVSTDWGATWTPREWTAGEKPYKLLAVAMSADGTKQTAVGSNGQIYVSSADVSFSGHVGIGTTEPGADSLDVRGRCYSSVAWATTGADYAEFLEAEGNSDIPPGTSVISTEDGKIRPCKKGETPIGVISANPAIIGNSYKEWPKKYLRNVFGGVEMEESKEEVMAPTRPGDPDYPNLKGTGQYITRRSPKLNPNYRPELKYEPREQRPSWHRVGLLGQLTVLKDQPTAKTWVKLKDISKECERWLVK